MSSNQLSDALERSVERIRSVTVRLASSNASPAGGRLRPTSVGGLLVVLTSVGVSLASATVLGDSVRIRWSVGAYYGPEYAPTPLALAAFPALVVLTYVGFRALTTGLERADAFDQNRVRRVYELCILVTLTMLVIVQVVFVVANLL